MPEFEYQQFIIGNRPKSETWLIKFACLKPEHRFNLLNNKGLLPVDYNAAYARRNI